MPNIAGSQKVSQAGVWHASYNSTVTDLSLLINSMAVRRDIVTPRSGGGGGGGNIINGI